MPVPRYTHEADPKDPGETVKYQIDWTEDLGGDTISTSAWAVRDGDVTIDSDTNTTTTATVTVSGGTRGVTSIVTNTITTSDGETLVQSIGIPVRQI